MRILDDQYSVKRLSPAAIQADIYVHASKTPGPLLLTGFNFNSSMNEWPHAQWSVGWIYQSLLKLHQYSRWSLGKILLMIEQTQVCPPSPTSRRALNLSILWDPSLATTRAHCHRTRAHCHRKASYRLFQASHYSTHNQDSRHSRGNQSCCLGARSVDHVEICRTKFLPL